MSNYSKYKQGLVMAVERAMKNGYSKDDAYNTSFMDSMLNRLLVDLLGYPGGSNKTSTSSSSSSADNGDSAYGYTAAQADAPAGGNITAVEPVSTAIAGGIGLIRDILGYAYSDHSAKQSYERQNEFYDAHQSMPAKVQEYRDAGLNPMGLGAAGVGATSAPSVDSAVNPGGSAAIDVLGQILNYKLQTRAMDLEDKRIGIEGKDVASKVEQRTQETLYQQKVNEWFETNQTVAINESIARTNDALEHINTQRTEQALNEAGVTKDYAQAALTAQLEIEKIIDNKYRDAWNRVNNNLARAQAKAANAAAAASTARAAYDSAAIENLVAERTRIMNDALRIAAETGVIDAQLPILGLQKDQLQFAVDHQKGDLIWQRIGQGTAIFKDVALGAGGLMGGGAAAGLINLSKPQRPLGFTVDAFH